MRIIGISCIGANEKFLKQGLDDFKRLRLDDVVIVGNNTDKETEKLIKSYGYWFYRDDREWGKYQPKIKTDLLEKLRLLNPDWIVAKDADEVFDERMGREELEEMASKGGIGYYFYVVNLWNDEQHHSKQLNFWNIRFYKFAPEHGLRFQNKNVHCGWAPPIVYYYGNYAPYLLKHYGLMLPEDRERKVRRYEIYDPNAVYKDRSYYEELKSSSKGVKFDEATLSKRIEEEVRNYKMKKEMVIKNDEKVFVYIEREDGSTFDVPKRDVEQTLRLHPKWKVKGEINLTTPTGLPVDTAMNSKQKFGCILCGNEFNKESDLLIHKQEHDKPKVADVPQGSELPTEPDNDKAGVGKGKQGVRGKKRSIMV